MTAESKSPADNKMESGSFTSSFFRHPNGDSVREGTGVDQSKISPRRFDALARRLELVEMQLEMQLEIQKKSTGDETQEYLDLISSKKDDPDTNLPSVEQFPLPPSTYCLLFSTDICSLPFNTGIAALGLALICLVTVLYHNLERIKSPGNPFGMPGVADTEVIVAKYVAVLIAVLMENEIPTGLELIGKGVQQVLSGGRRKINLNRIILSSFVRFIVGYLFLTNSFLTIVQQPAALTIFFSILGLLFVENIDDVIFQVSKRGFFGRRLMNITNNLPSMEISSDTHKHDFTKWTMRSVRFVYFLNLLVGYIGLSYLTARQSNGDYRCQRFRVRFGDEIWENAHVNIGGEMEDRLLIYSHFNGIYEEEGTHDGRPRYVERNKENGGAYTQVIPAEIIYCKKIDAWVFRHENIRTSLNDDYENPCSWLMKSQSSAPVDITSITSWFMWNGAIEFQPSVKIECNQCYGKSSCNYNGQCVENACACEDGFYGYSCQHSKPCGVIRTEKDPNTTLELLPSFTNSDDFFESYGRPMYVIRNMTGKPYSLLRLGYPAVGEEYFEIEYVNSTSAGDEGELPLHKHKDPAFFMDDDFFEQGVIKEKLDDNYTFALQYTGRRWYGGLFSSEMNEEVFKEGNYHAFWDNVFSSFGAEDNSTFLISEPTSGGSPVGISFFEMRRRNGITDEGRSISQNSYDPFGVLIPLVGFEGSGFFHCN